MSTIYDTSSIKILTFRDHIRLRPGMYIGGLDEDGIHHLFREILDNSIDEIMAGHGNTIFIHLHKDLNVVCIQDRGRGIPFGIHTDTGKETLIELCCSSFSGGKFDTDSYDISSGMNGIGMGAVNALSEYMKVSSYRADGSSAHVIFDRGEVRTLSNEPIIKGTIPGTNVEFKPDETIFPDIRFNEQRIHILLSELSNILPKKSFIFTVWDKSVKLSETTYLQQDYLTGIYDDLKSPDEIFKYQYLKDDLSAIVWYNKNNHTMMKSFMNVINTEDHGSHVDGIVNAIINALKKITGRLFRKNQILPGLNIVVSMKYSFPIFKGQSKSKVADTNVEKLVYSQLYNEIYSNLLANKSFVNYLVTIIDAQSKVIDDIEIKSSISAIKDRVKSNALPAKLMAVYGCSPDDRELIICEGDSAMGGVSMARNPNFQEVLPIKGKILNPFKADIANVYKSKEVSDIFTAIGGMENTNTILRCKKVFILTDADADGSHIAALLASIFISLYPSFIKNHELYIMNTPLYTAVVGDNRAYGHTAILARKNFVKKFGNRSKPDIRLNKGLGEMASIELVDVLSPATRDIVKLEFGNDSSKLMEELMGSSVETRYNILKDLNTSVS